ncbi:hypothetical protein DFJ77DRAFT_524419 [Powellomyces hirtus]|nr:hypothetical protein DFJ77DRAFT_524419 [Powellomyces hirtus]
MKELPTATIMLTNQILIDASGIMEPPPVDSTALVTNTQAAELFLRQAIEGELRCRSRNTEAQMEQSTREIAVQTDFDAPKFIEIGIHKMEETDAKEVSMHEVEAEDFIGATKEVWTWTIASYLHEARMHAGLVALEKKLKIVAEGDYKKRLDTVEEGIDKVEVARLKRRIARRRRTTYNEPQPCASNVSPSVYHAAKSIFLYPLGIVWAMIQSVTIDADDLGPSCASASLTSTSAGSTTVIPHPFRPLVYNLPVSSVRHRFFLSKLRGC